jgi:hypothetical protein
MPSAILSATLDQRLSLSDAHRERIEPLVESMLSPDPYLEDLVRGPVLQAELTWSVSGHRVDGDQLCRTLEVQIAMEVADEETFLIWLKDEGVVWEGNDLRLRSFLTTFLYDFEGMDIFGRNFDFTWTVTGRMDLPGGLYLEPSAEMSVAFSRPLE